jgi:O-antigen ligase
VKAQSRGRRPVLAAGIAAAVAVVVVSVGYRVPAGLGHVPVPGGEWHFLKGPRVHTWLSAVGTVRDHPVTGLGYGSTVAHTPRIQVWITQGYAEPLDIDRPPKKDAHQTWLSVAAQAGLVGLGAYLAVLLVCWRSLRRALRWRPGTVPERLAVAAAAGLAGALVFHGLFASVEESRHVWALLGLGVAAGWVHGGNLRDET